MQEDFLHYVWKHKKFSISDLETTDGQKIEITSVGQHNQNAGPDFFNAQISIDGQRWAGNVEIHLNSSDWYVHHHETDVAYDSVILHVVWSHDTDIYRKDNSPLPTVELKNFIEVNMLAHYKALMSKSGQWINCANDLASVPDFTLANWLERLYFERLQQKSDSIEQQLNTLGNDWETVLFRLLAKNFGLKVNGEAFLSMASSMDFSLIRKTQSQLNVLEALFFGQSGLLQGQGVAPYYRGLKEEYDYLAHKFRLNNSQVLPVQFFRLRPPNFPTVRLAQLAALYHRHQNLFSKIISLEKLAEFYEVFSVAASKFWDTHYTFDKTSGLSKKKLSKSFVDLLLINTIVPLKFAYAKYSGKPAEESVLGLIESIKPERNAIVSGFENIRKMTHTALQSQSLITLKNDYCNKNKCLHCAIGHTLLKQ